MPQKKLLVLDVNGLLLDTYFHKQPLPNDSPDGKVGNFFVYKRPFCGEFIQFCLENFVVGVWSSAREYNVSNLVDYVFGESKQDLAFCWHQSDCTDVGLKSPDNKFKPLFLKELAKLWGKVKSDLPWNEGDYGPENTLLVDDTPYKAILNPPNTGIFPQTYTVQNEEDDFLGGALRKYLEGIRDASNVQNYVENNPIGEPSITSASPLWSYVEQIMERVSEVAVEVGEEVFHSMQYERPNEKWHDKRKRPLSTPFQEHNIIPSEAVELEYTTEIPEASTDNHKLTGKILKTCGQSDKSNADFVDVNRSPDTTQTFFDNGVDVESSKSLSCGDVGSRGAMQDDFQSGGIIQKNPNQGDDASLGGVHDDEANMEDALHLNQESQEQKLVPLDKEKRHAGITKKLNEPRNESNQVYNHEVNKKDEDNVLHVDKRGWELVEQLDFDREKGHDKLGVIELNKHSNQRHEKEVAERLQSEVHVEFSEQGNQKEGAEELRAYGLGSKQRVFARTSKNSMASKTDSKYSNDRDRHWKGRRYNQHSFQQHNQRVYHSEHDLRYRQNPYSKKEQHRARDSKMPHDVRRHRERFSSGYGERFSPGYRQYDVHNDNEQHIDQSYIKNNLPSARQDLHSWSERTISIPHSRSLDLVDTKQIIPPSHQLGHPLNNWHEHSATNLSYLETGRDHEWASSRPIWQEMNQGVVTLPGSMERATSHHLHTNIADNKAVYDNSFASLLGMPDRKRSYGDRNVVCDYSMGSSAWRSDKSNADRNATYDHPWGSLPDRQISYKDRNLVDHNALGSLLGLPDISRSYDDRNAVSHIKSFQNHSQHREMSDRNRSYGNRNAMYDYSKGSSAWMSDRSNADRNATHDDPWGSLPDRQTSYNDRNTVNHNASGSLLGMPDRERNYEDRNAASSSKSFQRHSRHWQM